MLKVRLLFFFYLLLLLLFFFLGGGQSVVRSSPRVRGPWAIAGLYFYPVRNCTSTGFVFSLNKDEDHVGSQIEPTRRLTSFHMFQPLNNLLAQMFE